MSDSFSMKENELLGINEPQEVKAENAGRLARLLVTPEFLISMLTGTEPVGFQVTANPLPADVEIVDYYFDWNARALSVVLRSASFAVVPDGEKLPELPSTVMKRIDVISGAAIFLTEPDKPELVNA